MNAVPMSTTSLVSVCGAPRAPLAVFAHPDDESFGLGALLSALAETGAAVAGLCFTHGEASTLGAQADLRRVRAEELRRAAAALGLSGCALGDHPDGGLPGVPVEQLAAEVVEQARLRGSDLLVVFDDGGVTGHPDHQAATAAAVHAGRELAIPVLAWVLAADVADSLNSTFGTTFVGRGDDQVDAIVAVDRTQQLAAIACHDSQSSHNPVLRRRLQLCGTTERLRWLHRPPPAGAAMHDGIPPGV